MPQPDHEVLPRLMTREERKQLLTLACATDRAAWAEACRPEPGPSRAAQVADRALLFLEPVTGFLPGRIGRWVRRAALLARLGRHLGLMR